MDRNTKDAIKKIIAAIKKGEDYDILNELDIVKHIRAHGSRNGRHLSFTTPTGASPILELLQTMSRESSASALTVASETTVSPVILSRSIASPKAASTASSAAVTPREMTIDDIPPFKL